MVHRLLISTISALSQKVTAEMDYSSLAYSYIISGLLEILIPLAVGYYIIHKYKTSWKTFIIGGIMFLISLIRIPLNSIATTTISSMGGPYTYTLIVAFASLTAGLFEETARYVSYRYLVKDHRIENGLTYGAGHGGTESIILVGLNVAIIGYLLLANPSAIPASHLALLAASPTYTPFLGVFERAMTLIVQISLSIMVLMTFITGRKIYYGAAIVIHFLLDVIAVLISSYGIVYSELVVAVFALGLGYWTYNMISKKQPESPISK